MRKRKISNSSITCFKNYLFENEKSALTIDKYLRDLKAFLHAFVHNRIYNKYEKNVK